MSMLRLLGRTNVWGLASVSEAHFYDMRKEKRNKIDGSREGYASKEGGLER